MIGFEKLRKITENKQSSNIKYHELVVGSSPSSGVFNHIEKNY